MRENQIKNCNFAQKYKKNKMRKEYAEKLNGTTIEIGCSNENDKSINLTEFAGLLFHVEGNKLIPDMTDDILELTTDFYDNEWENIPADDVNIWFEKFIMQLFHIILREWEFYGNGYGHDELDKMARNHILVSATLKNNKSEIVAVVDKINVNLIYLEEILDRMKHANLTNSDIDDLITELNKMRK